MKLNEAREIVREALAWKKTGGGGYEMPLPDGGLATLQKVGTRWMLAAESHTHDLGRKASFGHAEGTLRNWGLL